MRAASSRLSDFNQMLVVSVFVHLSLFTVLMFIPRPKAFPKLIVPVFNVDLVEIPSAKPAPTGQASVPPLFSPQQEEQPAEVVETLKAEAPAPPPSPVPVEKPAEKVPVPEAPVKPAAKPEPEPRAPLLEELEQLAKAPDPAPPKAAPQKPPSKPYQVREKIDSLKKTKPAPLPKASVEEEALRETEVKKPKPEAPDLTVPENILADLDKVIRETSSVPEKSFEELAARKETKETKKKPSNEPEELLYEFKKMPSVTEEFKTQVSPDKPTIPDKSRESIDANKEKPVESGDAGKNLAVNIDIESGKKAQPEKFTSSIRPSVAKPPAGASPTALSKDVSASAASGQPRSETSADVLSIYVSKIREKIYANWKIPLGTEYNKRTVVDFYLFRGGNIDKPTIKESSGTENLDSLAIRAVSDSEPFPKFPDELKEPNLHITIHFKLTPGQ